MRKVEFTSAIKIGGQFDRYFNQEEVKNEPMFFNSDLAYAFKHGGIITRAFINQFLAEKSWEIPGARFVFDSRVHMLMKGWYPCIPGFHHDDVPRGENGQPDYITPAYRAKHVMGLVNGEICPTQFAIGDAELTIPENDIIYKHWHPEVVQLFLDGKLEPVEAPSGMLVYFDWATLHQGQPALTNGWRWFGRISWDTDRANNVTNEIRRQVQVYLEYPMEGW